MPSNNDASVLDQISESKKQYDLVVQKRNQELSDARKRLKNAKRKHDSKVKQCKSELDEIERSFSDPVARLGKVKLYQDRVESGLDVLYFEGDVKAEVNTSGSVYTETQVKSKGPSIGGAIIGGAIAGPAGAIIGGQRKVKTQTVKHDERKLYLTISSSSNHIVAEMDPSRELEARKLAGQIETTARSAHNFDERKKAAMAPYKKALKEAQADTIEIDTYTKELQSLEANTTDVDDAKAHHEAFVATFDAGDIEAEKKGRRRAALRKALGVLLILIGLFCLLTGWVGLTGVRDGAFVGVVFLLLADAAIVAGVMKFKG